MAKFRADDEDTGDKSYFDFDDEQPVFTASGSIDIELAHGLIHQLGLRQPTEVTLNFHSAGGCMSSMFAIHDAIITSKSRVTTRAFGSIESAAVLVVACSHVRLAGPTTKFMIHPVKFSTDKQLVLSDVLSEMKEMERQIGVYAKLMASYTKKKEKFWLDCFSNAGPDRYFNADEAIKMGIIDRVLKPGK